MGRSIRFPSLGSHEFGYLIHSSVFAYDFASHDATRSIAPWAGIYQTYGEGMVQHSPDWCAPVSAMGDYLASLTTFCIDPRNEDALEVAADHWKSMESGSASEPRNIAKARKVRFKEGKPRYVCQADYAVSSAESKRHDRRWYEIVEWMDGSVNATFSILFLGRGRAYGFERYAIMNRIIKAMHDDGDGYAGAPEDHFEPFKGQHLDRAFGAFESLATSHLNRKLVKPLLDLYGQDVARSLARQQSA